MTLVWEDTSRRMGAKLTFLHAADLHLGAPMRGLRALSDVWADRLLEAIPEAYDRLIDAAVKNAVDFVVVAGDIFDTTHPSYADYVRFFDGMRRLGKEGIPVYLCTGNHDPYTSWEHDFAALPNNVTMFSAPDPSFVLHERNGEPLCVLGGRGYYNQTWPANLSVADGLTRADADRALGARGSCAPFGVAVAHTGMMFDRRNAPVEASVLLQCGFDYWALGHVHAKMLLPKDNPRIGYSGCIQGRDIAETGERGVYLVTLEQGHPAKARFVPTASVVWERLTVNVEDCAHVTDITDKVLRELFRANGDAQCEEMCVRVTLTGATDLHEVLSRPGVIEDMRKTLNTSYAEFFCDALVDATLRPVDKTALRDDALFPSVLLRAADALRAAPGDQAAYLQDEFLSRGFAPPSLSEEESAALVDDAERIALDLLFSEGERL